LEEVDEVNLSAGAWAVLIMVSAILYGGTVYYILIALKLSPQALLRKMNIEEAKRYWHSGTKARVAMVSTFLMLILILAMWAWFSSQPPSPTGQAGQTSSIEEEWASYTVQGFLEENSAEEFTIEFDGRAVTSATFVLSWIDDDTPENQVGRFGSTNQPDSFALSVTYSEDGDKKTASGSNDVDTKEGSITLTITLDDVPEGDDYISKEMEWLVLVECTEAGDSEGNFSGIVTAVDEGNDWALEVEYSYLPE
jgi:hypothetical protein